MHRREFLRASVATLSLAAAGCSGSGFTPPAVRNENPRFPHLNFITRDLNFSDYRPAVDSAGEIALFERTPKAGGDTKLRLAGPISAPEPPVTDFLKHGDIPDSQTRPDWCWQTGQVAFNGASNDTAPHVLVAESDGGMSRSLPGTDGYNYPIWHPDGSRLVVFNDSSAASPRPCSSLIMPDGTLVTANMNGLDDDGVPVFAGFAAPNPKTPILLAFAGQPTLPTWVPAEHPGCPNDPSGYNQCFNYPFLNRFSEGVFTSHPLEAGAPIAEYDPAFQGRAPYFSPDGRFVVFESDRAGGYALFLADLVSGAPPVQLTDSAYQAQHAKFFPSGDRLILTCLHDPEVETRGIAWIDISNFVR